MMETTLLVLIILIGIFLGAHALMKNEFGKMGFAITIIMTGSFCLGVWLQRNTTIENLIKDNKVKYLNEKIILVDSTLINTYNSIIKGNNNGK